MPLAHPSSADTPPTRSDAARRSRFRAERPMDPGYGWGQLPGRPGPQGRNRHRPLRGGWRDRVRLLVASAARRAHLEGRAARGASGRAQPREPAAARRARAAAVERGGGDRSRTARADGGRAREGPTCTGRRGEAGRAGRATAQGRGLGRGAMAQALRAAPGVARRGAPAHPERSPRGPGAPRRAHDLRPGRSRAIARSERDGRGSEAPRADAPGPGAPPSASRPDPERGMLGDPEAGPPPSP